jgi:ribosomal protein S18 acetylase RimI-like enzyme
VFAQLRLYVFREFLNRSAPGPYDANVSSRGRTQLVLPDDVDRGAEVLTAAFASDPMVMWMLHGATHPEPPHSAHHDRAKAGFFRPALDIGRQRGHSYVVWERNDVRGACVWAPPGTTVFDDVSVTRLIEAMSEHLGHEALQRMSALGALCRSHHPVDPPHFYLFLIGTMPSGQGWGEPLLAPVLQRCDADGLGAYLESSTPRNQGFYRRHGFAPIWQDRPDGGPVMTGMWRDPR